MSEQNQQIYGFDSFRLDVPNRKLQHAGAPVFLQAKAFDVLVVLIENGGRLMGKDELFSRVWPNQIVEESNLTVQVSAIRRALGDSKGDPHYIVTVPGHGYRFTGSVRRLMGTEEESVVEDHPHSRIIEEAETQSGAAQETSVGLAYAPKLASDGMVNAGSVRATARATENFDITERTTSSAEYLVGKIGRHRKLAAVALAVLLIALTAAAYLFYTPRGKNTEIHSIAILPFRNVGADPDAEYLSDGLTESLINSLSKLANLRVTARTTAFSFKGRSVDPRQAGHELGVDAVLTGQVTQRGDTLTIQADLISVADGSQLWGEQYPRKLSDILAVQGEIAREISAKMRRRLSGAEEQQLSQRYTENVEAYQLYLQGRYFWNKVTDEAVKKSEGYFKQAIEKDPNYALAYAGLADTYVLSSFISMASPAESYGQAKVAATKALEIDDKLGDAHATLALILTWYDWNWPAGEAEFKRALELSPNSATAHQGYGRALTIVGRFDEALAELRLAHDLDPFSIIIDADLEGVFLFSRRYDESINQNRKIIDMEARFVFAYIDLSVALEQTGKRQEAITELQKALSLENENPFVLSLMGFYYAKMGAKEKAHDFIKQLTELSQRKYVSQMHLARVYAGLGNKDQAFDSLEQAYQGRDYNMPFMGVDQTFDSLHSDPRFSVLVRRIGVP